jgi:G3E family GTPase
MGKGGPARATPLTIIGGYLGAGKTTLVNHLLRAADGLRLAVLVNEFGELPIDRDLIEGRDGNVISIAGGCVCCSYGNDLVMTLQEMAAGEVRFDHVLLEASGVGIPSAIAATVSLMGAYTLDGVVVVADAETIEASARDRYMGETVIAQLAEADLVVLNKLDLVDEAVRCRVERWIGEVASGARVVTATRAVLPPAVVLESFLGRERGAGKATVAAPDTFETITPGVGEPVDPEAFARRLIEHGYVRAKGFVVDQAGEMRAVQVVGRRFEIAPAPAGVRPGVVAIRLRIA